MYTCEGGPLCIIYNSSFQGEIISLKKTESVAYIHVGNAPAFHSWITRRRRRNYTKAGDALKAAALKGYICFSLFLKYLSRGDLIRLVLSLRRYLSEYLPSFLLSKKKKKKATWLDLTFNGRIKRTQCSTFLTVDELSLDAFMVQCRLHVVDLAAPALSFSPHSLRKTQHSAALITQ